MNVKIGILRDDLLLIVAEGVRPDMLDAMRAYLDNEVKPKHGINAIIIGVNGGGSEIIDLRRMTPEASEAAKVVADWATSQ